jgi:ubiquinone/menaquinone biosynthesis C-methylase UbiE
MSESQQRSVWESGEAYEPYVGRWGRLVAREFLRWLGLAPASRWLDVGCGTGALSATILAHAAPSVVHGIDPSAGFLAVARHHVQDTRARFTLGNARHLPMETASYDVVVSGLVLNFIPDLPAGLAEMVRVTRPGGTGVTGR